MNESSLKVVLARRYASYKQRAVGVCRGGEIQRRTAVAATVWKLLAVFLCVMHANPGPRQVRQQYKETSVRLTQLQS